MGWLRSGRRLPLVNKVLLRLGPRAAFILSFSALCVYRACVMVR